VFLPRQDGEGFHVKSGALIDFLGAQVLFYAHK
jgi:hypothetical protein